MCRHIGRVFVLVPRVLTTCGDRGAVVEMRRSDWCENQHQVLKCVSEFRDGCGQEEGKGPRVSSFFSHGAANHGSSFITGGVGEGRERPGSTVVSGSIHGQPLPGPSMTGSSASARVLGRQASQELNR